MNGRPVEILLVEDNPGDVRLTIEALRESKVLNNLSVARDGEAALQSAARCAHGRRGMLAERVLAHELFGRAQLADVADAQVVGTNVHGGSRGPIPGGEKKPPGVWRFLRVS